MFFIKKSDFNIFDFLGIENIDPQTKNIIFKNGDDIYSYIDDVHSYEELLDKLNKLKNIKLETLDKAKSLRFMFKHHPKFILGSLIGLPLLGSAGTLYYLYKKNMLNNIVNSTQHNVKNKEQKASNNINTNTIDNKLYSNIMNNPYARAALGLAGGGLVGLTIGDLIGKPTAWSIVGSGLGALAGYYWPQFIKNKHAQNNFVKNY